MAETENPEAPIVNPEAPIAPRTARFGEGPEGKAARRERASTPRRPQRSFERLWEFLHEVRAEMRRVSWPTLTHVQNTTIITLIAVVFFSVYLFAVDQALAQLILGLDWLIEKIARLLGLA